MGVSAGQLSGGHLHGFHALRVRRVVAETSEAVSLVLDIPAELAGAFAYRAGQFVTFRLTIGGKQVLRSYSMSSSPDVDGEFQVTVKRVPGGLVSNWIADEVSSGAMLETTRPAGVFCLGSGDGEILAYAGGSGVTPVYSLLKTALHTTARKVRLLYANRDRESTIFATELDALAERFPGRLEILHHFDVSGGFIEADAIKRHAETSIDAEVFICGPAPFMDLVERALHDQGVTADRIRIERFTPAEDPSGAPSATENAPDPTESPAGQVEIELDGKVQTANHRAGTTILQTARQMGFTPPTSCEAGDCATCMGRLLEGTATMRTNNALTEDEVAEGWILTCQAVPDPPLVRVIYGYD